MWGSGARRAGVLSGVRPGFGIVLLAALAACSHQQPDTADINTYPANYKSDILGAMHAYLNDPTGIRDAALSDPALKTVGNTTRYVACVKFNGKRNGGKDYAGLKEIAAVFQVGRFDRFVDTPKELKDLCVGVTYAPFPELEKLPP
jgi:hypothetical protein